MKYVAISSVLVCMLLMSCEKEVVVAPKQLRPIKYEQVGYGQDAKSMTFSGTAQTDKVIKLSFRSSGIITKFNIKLGQKVRKGQLLATLDNVNARLSYEQAITSLNSAESQRKTAKLNVDRVRSLYEIQSASLSDYENAKNSYATAVENYNSAQRGVDLQKQQITFGYIYAPEHGVISAVHAEIDENVSPGQTIATLNAGKDMEINLGIPERVINNIEEGMAAKVSFSALDGQTFHAKVTEVSPAVESASSTYPVKVTVTDPSKDIKSGMAANVEFEFGGKSEGNKDIVIPASAVGADGGGNFVFLVADAGGKTIVKKHKVVIGEMTERGIAITNGLQSGQKIATAGLQTLLDGQEVELGSIQ